MVEAQNLISKIKDRRENLRKSERKVADFVLDHTQAVLGMRIVDVAAGAEVSEPTVVRFCHALDIDGFQAFKLQLAQHLGASSSYSQFSVDDRDTIADLSHKVFDSTIGSLLTVRDELDPAALERAIAAINNAKRVEFYGFGGLWLGGL